MAGKDAWDIAFQLKGVTHIDRATAWEFVPAQVPGAAAHRPLRDAVVVSFEGQTPHGTFVTRGTVHNDEGTGRAGRAYIFELK